MPRRPSIETGALWAPEIPEAQWRVYRRVLEEAEVAGIPVAFGGAFALAAYGGELRNTKDLDLYILPEDRHAMIEAMSRAGLTDYYDQAPYDRAWIYRGAHGESLVDAIWAMANLRTLVDMDWLTLGPELQIHGNRVRPIPAEELIWSKLYVLQRSRSDWLDVLNLLDAMAPRLDWDRLMMRMGPDLPLLAAALSVFAWLAPARASQIAEQVWTRAGARPPEAPPERHVTRARADLLDSRPWFRGAETTPD
ncbi:MAG TPA: hypothetical protein VMY76_16965 [Gemmatimonadales bacterium]|nr:hypothetical protein [Gemmatimonadales bacterium]